MPYEQTNEEQEYAVSLYYDSVEVDTVSVKAIDEDQAQQFANALFGMKFHLNIKEA